MREVEFTDFLGQKAKLTMDGAYWTWNKSAQKWNFINMWRWNPELRRVEVRVSDTDWWHADDRIDEAYRDAVAREVVDG